MPWYRWNDGGLELFLKVQPRAPRNAFVGPEPDGELYRVRIQAPPVDGKANDTLRRFLAAEFGVAQSRVSLIAGEKARCKRWRIEDPQCFPLPIDPP